MNVVKNTEGRLVDLGSERIWELFKEDFGLAFVEVEESKEHFHKYTKEVYIVVEGTGKLKLGDDVIELSPGTCVFIPPGTKHCVFDGESLKLYVFTVPAWSEDDHHEV